MASREARLYAEIVRGNVPEGSRRLESVDFTARLGGREHRVRFWVTADYLAVGSDEDHLLVPLSPGTGQRIADEVGASLPTPTMVDAVWASARFRLAPQRLPPEDSVESVRSVEFFRRHNNLIQAQEQLRGVDGAALVAGHKKDVVLTTELAENPGKVAIYGWHGPDGTPNQPLSTAAADTSVYYNHGVRLVHRTILVDGEPLDLGLLLTDPELAHLVSQSGPITPPRYEVAMPGSSLGESPVEADSVDLGEDSAPMAPETTGPRLRGTGPAG